MYCVTHTHTHTTFIPPGHTPTFETVSFDHFDRLITLTVAEWWTTAVSKTGNHQKKLVKGVTAVLLSTDVSNDIMSGIFELVEVV